ncbi:TPA: hypothetical protein N0F65_012350 [Lagenidium giganteum]|uniref:Rab3 GTPase-activating protein catalytic subunit n=1 Tax=Lagenidium giganteum TaxID=4803 RepID=A0AAV2YEM0_9STRA|nr:TPA: hypothetical protein N0F65_012350 [Lagenidium giganteum]
MTLDVEEDPSSQFVDFTNATALEQFISDIEQTLITWQLTNRGHASPTLAGGSGASPRAALQRRLPTCFQRVIELDTGAATSNYAITLFTAPTGAWEAAQAPQAQSQLPEQPPSSTSSASSTRTATMWQEGLEHFTPTMLAVADSSGDFQWDAKQEAYSRAAAADDGAGRGGLALGYDVHGRGAETAGDDGRLTRWKVHANVQKWFGVNDFLLLSRTSRAPTRRVSGTLLPSTTTTTTTSSVSTVDKLAAELTQHASICDPVAEEDLEFELHMEPNEGSMLLSALTIALTNCNCTLPAFVPLGEPSHGSWIGAATPGTTGNASLTFDTDSVPELNANQGCISSLLDFFKLKLQLPPQVEEETCRLASSGAGASDLTPGMWVSASFGYQWTLADDAREVAKLSENRRAWRTADALMPADADSGAATTAIASKLFGKICNHYWGTETSPLADMGLTVIWPNLREGTYVDNVVHSTLDPHTAPEWLLDVNFQPQVADNDRKPTHFLSKLVANLVQAYFKSKELSKDVLVSELAPSSSYYAKTSSSSSRLQESIPAARAAVVLGNAIGSLTSTLVSAATWKGSDIEEIRRVVAELFDDEDMNESAQPRVLRTCDTDSSTTKRSIRHGAPVGQLVSILACRMGQLQGVNAMSLLWVEFVKALRERWFQNRLLPFMNTEHDQVAVANQPLGAMFLMDAEKFKVPDPDFHQCLLHQKLQLLNCCLYRQADRSPKARGESPKANVNAQQSSRVSDLTSYSFEDADEVAEGVFSDDEFFDTMEDQDSGSGGLSTAAAEGIRRPIPGVIGLMSKTPLMEPHTQLAVPLTEDIAKLQQDLLSRLGVTQESALLRQQIQSTSLVSDMQAFKAANPGACLADFVRWYSPRDWIPFTEDQRQLYGGLPADGKNEWWFENQGMLSERMRAESSPAQANLWKQTWESSVALPVQRQKRLFDPVQESEKLYHYLEMMSPHEMFHQMLVGAITTSYWTLENALGPVLDGLPSLKTLLKELLERSNRAIALLDDALGESQVAFPAGKNQKEQQERAKGQLQVAFEMALDACWKLVSSLDATERAFCRASALLHYFTPSKQHPEFLSLVDVLLRRQHGIAEACGDKSASLVVLLKQPSIRKVLTEIVLDNSSSRDPVRREYVLRCICPRPFLRDWQDKLMSSLPEHNFADSSDVMATYDSPLVVSRMYAAFKKHTVRFAMCLAESEF